MIFIMIVYTTTYGQRVATCYITNASNKKITGKSFMKR